MRNSKLLAILTIVSLGTTLTACSSSSKDTNKAESDTKKLKVVATTTQICDYTKEIAKDKVDLTCLLAPNASAHELELTASQMKALEKADLLLKNGVNLEAFLNQAIKASGFKGKVVETSKNVKLNKWTFPGENGQAPEFENDPHIWTSPLNAKTQVENVVTGLSSVDSRNAKFFKENGTSYTQSIDELDKWAEKSINSIPENQRILFTSHDAFGYFSQRYKIQFLGSAIPDFSDLGEATAQHLKEVAQKIKDSGAKVIFAENSNSDKNIKTLARETKVKVASEHDAMYGDSLGPKGSSGETYIGSIIHNVKSFVKNTGGKIADLPKLLKKYDKNKK